MLTKISIPIMPEVLRMSPIGAPPEKAFLMWIIFQMRCRFHLHFHTLTRLLWFASKETIPIHQGCSSRRQQQPDLLVPSKSSPTNIFLAAIFLFLLFISARTSRWAVTAAMRRGKRCAALLKNWPFLPGILAAYRLAHNYV
jgi:hypothetical protein